jgi:hypothetical protein
MIEVNYPLEFPKDFTNELLRVSLRVLSSEGVKVLIFFKGMRGEILRVRSVLLISENRRVYIGEKEG